MDDATRADMAAWTGCIAGALTRAEFERALTAAGLTDIEIRETHRVHEHAGAAIIRARKPGAGDEAAGCCAAEALEVCCEPAAKSECCGPAAADSTAAPTSCGCASCEGEGVMTNLNALLVAERQRQIRVNAAPRCCGSPARPRVSRELRCRGCSRGGARARRSAASEPRHGRTGAGDRPRDELHTYRDQRLRSDGPAGAASGVGLAGVRVRACQRAERGRRDGGSPVDVRLDPRPLGP